MRRDGRCSGRQRRGSALVFAVVASLLALGTGAALLTISTSSSRRQVQDIDTTRAFYIAEAGLAESFHAVRIGRTGQVGSLEEPARFGNGLVWVDAFNTDSEQVRLNATALSGGGRSSLSMVVEPVEVEPLGFFAVQDLVIEAELLVDGYDSSLRSYAEELQLWREVQRYAFDMMARSGEPAFYALLDSRVETVPEEYSQRARLEPEETIELNAFLPALQQAYAAGFLDENADPPEHTPAGAQVGSNGDVVFGADGAGVPANVFGDVTPGAEGAIRGAVEGQITGEIGARITPVELPAVQVPGTELEEPVRHEDLLPLVISTELSGYERIEVVADAELVVQGPATLVVGELVLEDGAALTLDTRNGKVRLFVTEKLDFQAGSRVTTTSAGSNEISLQIAPIAAGDANSPVTFDAAGLFQGTIYAPHTDVHIGGDFEVYGSVIARSLAVGAGARLHFDLAHSDALPRIVSWRIVGLPAEVRSRRGDPYVVLGISRGDELPIADAHDLDSVQLVIDYVDGGGSRRSYSGSEADFDWNDVSQTVRAERNPNRRDDDELEVVDPPAPLDPTPARPMVIGLIGSRTGTILRDALLGFAPLNDSELVAMLDSATMDSAEFRAVLDANPLSEGVLARLLNGPEPLTSADLKDVLLAKSPLPENIKSLVSGAPPTALVQADIDAVMAAQ